MFRMLKCKAMGNGTWKANQKHFRQMNHLQLRNQQSFSFPARIPSLGLNSLGACLWCRHSCVASREAAARDWASGGRNPWCYCWSWRSHGWWRVRSCSLMRPEDSPPVPPFASWWSSSGSLWHCQSWMSWITHINRLFIMKQSMQM